MSGKKRRLPRLLKAIISLAVAGVVFYSVLLGIVLSGARGQVTQEQPQTMIVLGCQVHPWGPSVLLQDRLDTALAYLQDHPQLTVIVSGGQGPDEHTSEARVMADYLVDHGVAEERILLEDNSHNTWQNLSYTVELMQENALSTEQGVVLVSSGFHLTRARLLWDRITGQGDNLDTLSAPSSHGPSRLWMHIREPLALVKSFVFDR